MGHATRSGGGRSAAVKQWPSLDQVWGHVETTNDVSVDIRPFDGGVVVELSGPLDGAAGAVIGGRLRVLTSRYDAPQITVDCGRVAHVDADGLQHLVQIARMAESSGRMCLRDVPQTMQELMADLDAMSRFTMAPPEGQGYDPDRSVERAADVGRPWGEGGGV